jgi:hypothetical protein
MRLPENERPDEIVDGIWDLVQLLDRDSGWQTSSGVDGRP